MKLCFCTLRNICIHTQRGYVCLCTSPLILWHNRQLSLQEKETNLVSVHVFYQFGGSSYYLSFISPVLAIYLTVTFFLNSQTRYICNVCVCVVFPLEYASQTVFFKCMMICFIDKFAFLLVIPTSLCLLGAHIFWVFYRGNQKHFT